jgi:hypothetical protein
MDSTKSSNLFTTSKAFAKPSDDYEHFFNYLRQSPSYKLALSDLNPDEPPVPSSVHFPKDFNLVRRTALAAKDIYNVSFENWWLEIGIYMFGERGRKPMPRIILEVGREARDPGGMLQKVAQSLYKPNYRNDGELFFVEFPAEASRAEMVRLVDQIHAELKSRPKLYTEAKFNLLVNKINRRTLELGHQAFDLYQNTDMELWRIGAEIGISDAYKDVLDPNAAKVRNEQSDEKRSMTAMVARLLKKAKYLSENAARGVFPSTDKPAYCAEFLRLKDKKIS